MVTNMQLSNERRSQLDNIVRQMIANEESDDTIQFVVDDFKKKYTAEVAQPNAQPKKKGIIHKAGEFVGDITGVTGTVKGVSEASKVAKGLITGKEYNPQVSPMQFAGSATKLGLTAGSLGTATPATLAGRVALGAGLGAGFSGAEAIESERIPTAKELAVGGTVGVAIPLAGEAIKIAKSAITQALPKSLIKGVLPGQTSNELSEHVLKNTKLGTTSTIYKNAKNSVKQISSEIDDILKNSPETISKKTILNSVAKSYGQTGGGGTITGEEAEKLLLKVAPDVKGLLSRDVLSIRDANKVRMAIDSALGDKFFLAKHTAFSKSVSGLFNSFLRDTVKSKAPQTIPLFDELSKEILLRNALRKSAESGIKLSLYDVMAALAGFTSGGGVGAVGAIAAERAARSPAVGIGVAKGLSKLGEKGLPEIAKKVIKTGVLETSLKKD